MADNQKERDTVSEEVKVTSIEELKQASTRVVEVSGFEPGETLKFKIRRASLLDLVEQGAVPNNLLNIVFEILKIRSENNTFNPLQDLSAEKFKDFCGLIDAVCKAVMIEPSYDEAREYLIDAQKIEIYQYAQYGLRVLEKFRGGQESDIKTGDNSKGVRSKAKQLSTGTGDA